MPRDAIRKGLACSSEKRVRRPSVISAVLGPSPSLPTLAARELVSRPRSLTVSDLLAPPVRQRRVASSRQPFGFVAPLIAVRAASYHRSNDDAMPAPDLPPGWNLGFRVKADRRGLRV